MRHAARTDGNQAKLVSQLRQIGASVQVLSAVGRGTPDLLVGQSGTNYLFEVKDPAQPPSGRKLTTDQIIWRCDWRGQYAVVETIDDCLAAFRRAAK